MMVFFLGSSLTDNIGATGFLKTKQYSCLIFLGDMVVEEFDYGRETILVK
jgi:hypothetical protein